LHAERGLDQDVTCSKVMASLAMALTTLHQKVASQTE